MAKIYRTTDRVEVKIHDITVKIAPLSLHQKNEVQSMMLEGQKTQDLLKLNEAIQLAIRFCIKDIKGVQDCDGNEYQLQFDGDKLSMTCLEDLMNMEHSPELVQVCSAFSNGAPKLNLEGVEVVEKK